MPNRQLTLEELETLANPLSDEVRKMLLELSRSDNGLHWALRRKLAKRLMYDEHSTPMQRRKLKAQKRQDQDGKCAVCSSELPATYTVLDRY